MTTDLKKYRVPKSAITERGLKKLIKDAAKGHSSVSDWASSAGILPQTVSAFLRQTQSAGLQIPGAFGYRPQTIYLPVGEEDISHANPPRRPAKKPSAKVDHSKDPVEKKHTAPKDERKDAKKRMKKRNKG